VQSVPFEISEVLQQFEDIFAKAMTLPPIRQCDHTIPLKEGSTPPNVTPYRIPYKQKGRSGEINTRHVEGFSH
jgi:hypothetical protein